MGWDPPGGFIVIQPRRPPPPREGWFSRLLVRLGVLPPLPEVDPPRQIDIDALRQEWFDRYRGPGR